MSPEAGSEEKWLFSQAVASLAWTSTKNECSGRLRGGAGGGAAPPYPFGLGSLSPLLHNIWLLPILVLFVGGTLTQC